MNNLKGFPRLKKSSFRVWDFVRGKKIQINIFFVLLHYFIKI